MKEKLEKINNKWVRLIVFVIVSVNSSFMIAGYQILPFDDEQIVSGLSIVALVASEVWNHWKNNSYTQEAKEADTYMKSRKLKLKQKK